jgi:pilus assembly protein CpaF
MTLKNLRSDDRDGDSTGLDRLDYEAARYRKRLLEEINLSDLSLLDPDQRRARLERVTSAIVSAEGRMLSAGERTQLISRVVDEALGLGILEQFLADETVTEIMVNGPDHIFIERNGRLERVEMRFADADHVYQIIDRVVSRVNRRVDESSPMVDARLPGGERVNVIVPPLALNGPTMTIRRFPKPYTITELIDKGSVARPVATLLGACVRARLNMIISGGTGSGKTTLLNALSAFIPGHERIITIEDAAELRLLQDHVVSLESRPPNVEGVGQVTIRQLVRNSLRMRPDRIIVGEVRGAETLDMLQAMNTGHEGSLATVHANTADDAIVRLETLASMSELHLPYETIRDQINNAIDIVVHLDRGVDGMRRVVAVAAISSKRRQDYQLVPLAEFVAQPIDRRREVKGSFSYHQLPSDLAARLALAGEAVPARYRAAGNGRASRGPEPASA